MWIKISIKIRTVFVLFFSGKIFSVGRRNYCHKELIIYWKWLSRSKGNRSFTFLSSTRSAEQKLSINANWKFVKREAKILHLNVGSNKLSLYQDWMVPLVLHYGAIKPSILQFKVFVVLLIVEKVKFWSVLRSEKFVHNFPLAFQLRSLSIEFVLVSWVVNFRVFRSKATRATHKTTVTIITGSNYASANNTIGSLIQFHCVHVCMSCATHANNPFHHRRKFQYRNGCASMDYLDKHLKIWDLISSSHPSFIFSTC